jgi:oxygen-independent coproporphyrinogen-3 oxidase
MNSLYIHIPFCAKKCLYCDFYSIIYNDALASDYVDALAAQIKQLEPEFRTVYIGGGTPTSLDIRLLEKLLKPLTRISQECEEFTIEANPESLSLDKLKLLKDYRVNRLSIGVQSFSEEKLKKLGRIHSAEGSRNSVSLARQAGFSNLNNDLIFGVCGERFLDWQNELKETAKLAIKHISCYGLTYEHSTPLFKKLKNKIITPLSDSLCAKMYKFALDYLPRKGFPQYEISNFSKRGFECRHSLNYWQNSVYTGLGASAVSFQNGVRERNIADASEYIKRIKTGRSAVSSREKLSARRHAKETAAIKIRTNEGIRVDWFYETTGFDFLALEADALRRLTCEGLLHYLESNGKIEAVRLTKKGIIFCDSVSSSLT